MLFRTFVSRRIAISTTQLAPLALLVLGCNEPARRFCEAAEPVPFSSAEQDFGFSVNEVLDTTLTLDVDLQWQPPPAWLTVNRAGDTTARLTVAYDDGDVEAIEKEAYNDPEETADYCVSYLETSVSLSIDSDDSALTEGPLAARLRMYGPTHFEIETALSADEVKGQLEVSSGTRLQPVVTVRDGKVSGGIRAVREVQSSRGDSLRLTVIAGWSGKLDEAG